MKKLTKIIREKEPDNSGSSIKTTDYFPTYIHPITTYLRKRISNPKYYTEK